MESNAVSAHGTLVTRNGTTIPELRDVTVPELTREVLETTRMGDEDNVHKVGIRESGLLYFSLNLLFDEPEHLGLLESWETTITDIWAVHFADGAVWTFEGFVTEFGPENPVDGIQSVREAVRPTGDINFSPVLLQEDGDELLLESGGSILT